MSSKTELIETIVSTLLPDAAPSRRKMLERVTSTMTDAQLQDTIKAVAVGVRETNLSRIRDIVESRDIIAITYISKWEQMVDISPIEAELNAQFSKLDEMYDVYSPTFEAHVEAYMTYHSYCTACQPHDLDTDYSMLDETFPKPPVGHYVDYLQDSDLMDFVQKNPQRVSELVRLAAERRGINKKLVKDYFAADASALAAGLL